MSEALDRAIEALRALPEPQREEVAELVLELAGTVAPTGSALNAEQLAEVRRRRASGFLPGDPDRIARLLSRLA